MADISAQNPSRKAIDYPDWIITLVLLGVMVTAFALTAKWPSHTAFFPRLLSGASIVLILFKLSAMLWTALAQRNPVAEITAAPRQAGEAKGIELVADVEEDQGDEEGFHNIFANADKRTWLTSIGWLALFFVGMYLVGMLITLPIFTVLYLRFVAKSSWTTCLLYVLGTAGVMYLLFDLLLHLPLPQGIFFEE